MNPEKLESATARDVPIGHIVVRGEFGPTVSAAFDDCEIAMLPGETLLTLPVVDQASLYGVLNRLQDFGASLISVSVRSRQG